MTARPIIVEEPVERRGDKAVCDDQRMYQPENYPEGKGACGKEIPRSCLGCVASDSGKCDDAQVRRCHESNVTQQKARHLKIVDADAIQRTIFADTEPFDPEKFINDIVGS